MSIYSFVLPNDFDEYAWEVTSKGNFSDAQLSGAGKSYRSSFYDAVRLNQEIESELDSGGLFSEPNLVIVRSVTREAMERAAEQLVQSGQLGSMIPD